MTLLELLQAVCDSYPEDLSYNTISKDVVLKINDVEYKLNRVYTDDHMYGDIVFEFSDD